MSKPYPYFISLDEAVGICQENPITISTEKIPITNSMGRIVASDVNSKVNDPGFDNSSMDGFAVIYSDTLEPPTKLKVVGISNAGTGHRNTIGPGEAVRIMTGGPLPNGADSIIPIELCDVEDDFVTLNEPSKPNYVRRMGEYFSINQTIFSVGETMSPEKISLCAAAGISELVVYKKLKIAIISTGDELRNLGDALEFGQIYESNSYGLKALIEMYGHEAVRFPNVIDDIDLLRTTLDNAANDYDCIITSGGVSMGDRDFVRILMQEEGEIKFWRVKMRPGSPPLFGTWNTTPIFGLPGNPVSSHVVFRAIVGKWLASITHSTDKISKYTTAILAEDIKTQIGFTTFRRVELFDENGINYARLKEHQGSGNIAGIAMSDGLTIILPNDLGKKGDVCKILLL
ncbi:MAG: gephyrin-like molybdotransferase Glp [Candidatus Thermoplasmatota archaeon]|nr:gephyrin-like molybdotransferase Glp [Candidatus Thermoplasmatota archaeon]